MTSRRSAMTVLELLVVMAIVMILCALLLPVFRSAKSQSKEAVCVTNIRQLQVAVENYAADNDGAYSWRPQSSDAMQPYLGNKILVCPLAKAQKQSASTGGYDIRATVAPGVEKLNPAFVKMFNECVDLRQSEFPYILDQNHLGRIATMNKRTVIILGRKNGSVKVVPGKLLSDIMGGSVVPPCDPLLGSLNL